MSDDLDIVFGDVTVREPRRSRRPDRDPSRACITVGTPQLGELPIFLDLRPADLIERHALRDTSVELGGILLGHECVDDETGEPFVWITEALEAKHYENTQASFTYTHDSWAEITRERDEKHADLDIIGWYHTHPDFGVFLSSHDLFIHNHFFAQPLNVAYVVDPIRQTRGFFQWRDGEVVSLSGFTVTSSRPERLGLARFVNDLEHLPNTEGTGGTISPRLEAELIAMLSRPHVPVLAAGSSASSGAAFALLGMLLGVLGLSAALWLNNLAKAVQEQSQTLKALETGFANRAEDAAVARFQAKEAALNSLLGDIRVGATTETFLESYQKAIRERDAARAALEAVRTEKTAVIDQSTRLLSERKSVDAQLRQAQQRLGESEQAHREAKQTYEAELHDLNGKLKAAEDLVRQANAGELDRKYQIAWFVAAAGVGGCVLLSLALLWSFARWAPDDSGGTERGPTGQALA